MVPKTAAASHWIALAAVLPFLVSCSTQALIEPGLSRTELESRREAYASEAYPVKIIDRRKFDPSLKPAVVTAPAGYGAGTIVVDAGHKLLYLVGADAKAHRYGIAVGAAGHAWSGEAVIGRKAKWPAWYPTDDMHAQTPELPRRIEPGPHNPLGSRALYLYQNGVDTLYRIHGTSEPWTIGTEASSGCIRMLNEDIIDLYDKAANGATVVVL